MKDKPRILIIEDEPPIRKILLAGLKDDYEILEAETGKEGVRSVATHNPDLVILDIGLPDIDGFEVTQEIRRFSSIPIIILSARDQDLDKVKTLDSGADDYLTKPFSMSELLARIRAALRRAAQNKDSTGSSVFESDGLKIDFSARQVVLDGEELHLTPTEYHLLSFLTKHAGKVVTHQQLLIEVWGAAYKRETQYLRVFMGQLRQKLKEDPAKPRFLITDPGVGYRFRVVEK